MLLALAMPNAYATAYTSSQNGNWNDAATWGGGGYPQSSSDSATIADTHTVTYNVDAAGTANCGAITINSGGTLTFSPAMTTELIAKGNITVNNGGILYVGTDASPIGATYTATIQIECASNGQYGIITASGATVEMTGSSSYHLANADYTQADLATDISASATSLTTDVSTGWKSGDVISIATSAYDKEQTELVTLSADATGTTVPITATTYAHTTGALICHYSRNVIFKSKSTSYATYAKLYGADTTIDLSYVEFDDIGYNSSYKNGLCMHYLVSPNIDHCSMRNTNDYYNLYIYSSRNLTIDHFNMYGITNRYGSYVAYATLCTLSYVNIGHTYGNYWWANSSFTVTNSHFYSGGWGILMYAGNNNHTFTNCKFYCGTSGGIYLVSGENNIFTNCLFSDPVTNGDSDVVVDGRRPGRIILRNCKLAISDETDIYYTGEFDGWVRSEDHDQTSGYNKTFYYAGEIERSGYGMPDTTKRAGDYAMRMYPYSYASSSPYLTLKLNFGVKSGQTPTASCYYYRNSASADQPTLSVSGCGLSGSATGAAASGAWSQLNLTSSTAATSTDVATATITLDAGGSGSSYYVYFDDFTVSDTGTTTASVNTGEFEYWFEGSTSQEVYDVGGAPGGARTMRHGNWFKDLTEQWFSWGD